MILASTDLDKFHPKPPEAVFWRVFCDNFRPEVVSDVIRSAFLEVRKTIENAASSGFVSNFSGTAFCLPHQLVGFLFCVCATISVSRAGHKVKEGKGSPMTCKGRKGVAGL